MGTELINALEQIGREKGINKDVIINAIEEALLSVYKKQHEEEGELDNVSVSIDEETGNYSIFISKTVVEEVQDADNEISIKEVREYDAGFELGDIVGLTKNM